MLRLLGIVIAIGCSVYCALVYARFEIPQPVHTTIGLTGVIVGVLLNLSPVDDNKKEEDEDV